MESLRPGKRGKEWPASTQQRGRAFTLASQTQRFCLGTVLVTCLLVASAPRKPEPLCLLTTHEVGTAGSYRGALLKAQELILINCKQRGAISGEGSEGMGPKPLSVSWRAASHVQGVVSSGCNLELGLDLYWNYIFTLPVSCGCEL